MDAAAAYCGAIAIGLSIPTFGMSVASAGIVAVILALASLSFHGASMVIDFFNEG